MFFDAYAGAWDVVMLWWLEGRKDGGREMEVEIWG